MLIHVVLFQLKDELSATEREDFRLGLESLMRIPSAVGVYVGTPASTPERPVIVKDYDFALTVVLPDLEAHDNYQAHELHQKFLQDFKPFWKSVRVIDAD